MLSLSPLLIRPFIESALREDLGRQGDITTDTIFDLQDCAKAVFRTRQDCVISGLDCVEQTFLCLDPHLKITRTRTDGDAVPKGTIIATIQGTTRAILSGERVALNFLSHLSGIATATHALQTKISHTKARITCTRKTTPNLRLFEKYAVRCGGGLNHRYGLDDAVMIKDNHIAFSGSITKAIEKVRSHVGHTVKIEVEVDNLEQLAELLPLNADIVLLDNMPPALLREAVRMIDGKMIIEASGGINLDAVQSVAETGVDIISVGYITHSAPIVDIGLDFE
jgi:nicotinate-nucleotide pyrophosphorylase (carboxylating)